LLDYKPAGIGRIMNPSSPLFKIGESVTTVADWIRYAQMNRYKRDGSGTKPYPSLMDEFVKSTMYQYYRDHLEDLNEEFRNQMNEFREGNLFFEIMQREVWNKTQSDTTALKDLFEKNKNKYYWKQSVDAIVFYCLDETTARSIAENVKNNPPGWRKTAESLSERVTADSSRFEWSQIPGLDNAVPKDKAMTTITVNSADNTASFAYILTVYTQPSPRSFEEAKGLVMNDYQEILEDEWTKSLKKKYPVRINQKVLNDILKK
jgi:peptidyl-prolyl cis-trans isomerase SurA